MCTVSTEHVPSEILQCVKAAANNLLLQGDSIDSHHSTFPMDLDGGWPLVHPHDVCISYAQLTGGPFDGLCGLGRGTPKVTRERAMALALLISACVSHPERFPEENLAGYHKDLPAYVAEGRRKFRELEEQTAKLEAERDGEEDEEEEEGDDEEEAVDEEAEASDEEADGGDVVYVDEQGVEPSALERPVVRPRDRQVGSSNGALSVLEFERELTAMRQELQAECEIAQERKAELNQEVMHAQRLRFAESSYMQTMMEHKRELKTLREQLQAMEAERRVKEEVEAAIHNSAAAVAANAAQAEARALRSERDEESHENHALRTALDEILAQAPREQDELEEQLLHSSQVLRGSSGVRNPYLRGSAALRESDKI